MSKVERAPIPPSLPQGRMSLSAGSVPVIAVVVLALAVGVDLMRRVQMPRYGESGELAVVQPEDQDEHVSVRVTPHLMDGQLTTPTWENLFKAYNLRDSDMSAALEAHNREVDEEEGYALPTTPIPTGTLILLPAQ